MERSLRSAVCRRSAFRGELVRPRLGEEWTQETGKQCGGNKVGVLIGRESR